MEMPDMSSIQASAAKSLDTAKSLGTQSTAKANAGVSMLTTSAKDTLQAIDGYGKSINDVLTETKSTLVSKINEAKRWLTEVNIVDFSGLRSALNEAAALKREAVDLKKQLTDTVSTGIGTVRGLTNAVLDPAEAVLWELKQLPFDKITDGKYWLQTALGTNIAELNDLGYLVKQFLDRDDLTIDQYKDTQGETAMAAGLVSQAIDVGNASILNAVLEKYSTDIHVKEAAILQWPTAVSQGNTGLMKSLISHFGKEYILTKYPNAIQQILTDYTVPLGTTTNDLSEVGNALNDVLVMIDTTWYQTKTVNTTGVNLALFTGASPSASSVLFTRPELKRPIRIAKHYPKTDVLAIAASHYPQAGFSA